MRMHIFIAAKENITCAHITYINTPQNTEISRLELPIILKQNITHDINTPKNMEISRLELPIILKQNITHGH